MMNNSFKWQLACRYSGGLYLVLLCILLIHWWLTGLFIYLFIIYLFSYAKVPRGIERCGAVLFSRIVLTSRGRQTDRQSFQNKIQLWRGDWVVLYSRFPCRDMYRLLYICDCTHDRARLIGHFWKNEVLWFHCHWTHWIELISARNKTK